MTDKDRFSLEQAYAFFHQKEKVYAHSTSEREMDHIEDVISSYVNSMSPSLYEEISGGDKTFLMEHPNFAEQLRIAVSRMERMLEEN